MCLFYVHTVSFFLTKPDCAASSIVSRTCSQMKHKGNSTGRQSDEDPPDAVICNVIQQCSDHGPIQHGGHCRKDPEHPSPGVKQHCSRQNCNTDQDTIYRMDACYRPDPDGAEHRKDQTVEKQDVFCIQNQEHCHRNKQDQACDHKDNNHRSSFPRIALFTYDNYTVLCFSHACCAFFAYCGMS